MKMIEGVRDMKECRYEMEQNGSTVGFVPTMGALHDGHMQLVERAKQECDRVVLSIFVNPTQFNNPGDLEKYPRTLENDLELARRHEIDVVFLPQYKEIYADEYRYKIQEIKMSSILCGASRPGHFDGVLTVVLKLLNITRPQRAYFGEKDYQQYLLIRDMAKAFLLSTEIIGMPTVRENDGLAMSSRNSRLTKDQRLLAPLIYRELRSGKPLADVRANLENAGFRVDYLEEHFGRKFVAAFLGEVRLIDNV